MIHRSFRYRLYPTVEQAERLSQFVGTVRFVYNLAWEQRWTFGRRGRSFNYVRQSLEVTDLRREFDWIASAPSSALTQCLRDLDKAYNGFFTGKGRYPSPRRKGVNDSFRVQGKETAVRVLNDKWAEVRVPNLGYVKLRYSRPILGTMQSVTVSLVAGQWFAIFACLIEHEAQPSTLPAVGIDRGVANTVALSTGELLSTPSTDALERRKKRAQRILARRMRGSNRYRKQRRDLSRITAKIARVRAHWRHEVTTGIAKRFGHVALEDLNTKGMTASGKRKRGLNRSILEQGWRAFEEVLAYKLEERGGSLTKVNPAYTSQTCSVCGTVDKASRESQASYACRHCGFAIHADTNAAINILRQSLAVAEGGGYAPDEARTDALAA